MKSLAVYPASLKAGDTVAIVSPAGAVLPERIDAAAATLRAWGFDVVVSPHAKGRYGTYSALVEMRLADLSSALLNPKVRCIVCGRGGYGAVHLFEELDRLPLPDDPKWIVGFSDISALHALMAKKGIVSLHASMAKQLAQGPDDPINRITLDILAGSRPSLTIASHPLNRKGEAQGRLIGGNLAVLSQLIATPYDVFSPGDILYIEDIAEPVYKIERILWQLRLMGILPRLAALVVGKFTEYKIDGNGEDMEQMIARMVAPYDYPVAFGAPIGHVPENTPILNSALAHIKIGDDSAAISYDE